MDWTYLYTFLFYLAILKVNVRSPIHPFWFYWVRSFLYGSIFTRYYVPLTGISWIVWYDLQTPSCHRKWQDRVQFYRDILPHTPSSTQRVGVCVAGRWGGGEAAFNLMVVSQAPFALHLIMLAEMGAEGVVGVVLGEGWWWGGFCPDHTQITNLSVYFISQAQCD